MISDSYKEDLKQLHQKKTFGNRNSIPVEVIRCIEKYEVKSILDFGCGKGNVINLLKERFPDLEIYGYDPSQEQFDILPSSVDMIMSTDVLEHIEPELLNETIIDLSRRANKVMYHLIACHPAKKTLPDGRNAHLIIEEPEWWRNKLFSILDWNLSKEEILDYDSILKKGNSVRVIKYCITLEKYGTT